jgi:hypothetical protein
MMPAAKVPSKGTTNINQLRCFMEILQELEASSVAACGFALAEYRSDALGLFQRARIRKQHKGSDHGNSLKGRRVNSAALSRAPSPAEICLAGELARRNPGTYAASKLAG